MSHRKTSIGVAVGVGLGIVVGVVLSGASVTRARAVTDKKPIYGESKPVGAYSPGIDAGDTVYLAGQIGIDPAAGKMVDGGVAAETRQVMKNAEGILRAAGLGFEDVAKTTVFLADIKDFQTMNEVYASFFEGKVPPARSTVAVSGLAAGASVEIDFIAVR